MTPTKPRFLLILMAVLSASACDSKAHETPVAPCEPGMTDCDGDGVCETDIRLRDNCGGCGNVCQGGQHATATCTLGRCGIACEAGWGDCYQGDNDPDGRPADGCESALDTPAHCGSCGSSCASACVAGACQACDDDVALDSNDPLDAARAMDICEGVVSARWTLADGADAPAGSASYHLGHGNLAKFGEVIVPRLGHKLMALSSGTARAPGDPGFYTPAGFDKAMDGGGHPPGFPRESPACPGIFTGAVHDPAGLELELKVPMWARGIAFDFDFFTYEWPGYVCSEYNDFFVALLSPKPPTAADEDISFDTMGNPISVNAAFVSVCGCSGGPPCTAGGKSFACAKGDAELHGTGFDFDGDHASTSWLTTVAPVAPGSTIRIRFVTHDSNDPILDSTTLLDKFRWLPDSPVVNTEPIP
jgi:hypothetical protein